MRALVPFTSFAERVPCRMVLDDDMVVTGIGEMVFACPNYPLMVLVCLRLWCASKFYAMAGIKQNGILGRLLRDSWLASAEHLA